jgi:hypothetical protein
MRHPGTIVQLGAGKPGEESSEAFEQALFQELGLVDPSIAFIPFHHLPHGENDWTRFCELYRPLTRGSFELVELVPFQRQPDPKGIRRKLAAADLVVLGSGLVEPYVSAIVETGLDKTLAGVHREGTVLYGYSAGSIALGAEMWWHPTGAELLELLEEVLHTVLADLPLEDGVAAFCGLFEPHLDSRRLHEMLRLRREHGPAALADAPFATEIQATTCTPCLQLVPGLAAYPHFGDHGQTSLEMVRRIQPLRPELVHVGLPNGTAAVTRFGPEGPRTVARGTGRRLPVTWLGADGTVRTCADNEPIPLPQTPHPKQATPPVGIA